MMTIFKEKLLRFPQRNLPGESECPEKWQGTDSLTAPALGTGPPGRRPQGADEAGGGGGKRQVDTCTRRRMTPPQTRDREHSAAIPCPTRETRRTRGCSLTLRGAAGLGPAARSHPQADPRHLPRRRLMLLTLPGGAAAGWLLPHHVGHAHI